MKSETTHKPAPTIVTGRNYQSEQVYKYVVCCLPIQQNNNVYFYSNINTPLALVLYKLMDDVVTKRTKVIHRKNSAKIPE